MVREKKGNSRGRGREYYEQQCSGCSVVRKCLQLLKFLIIILLLCEPFLSIDNVIATVHGTHVYR